MQFTKTALVAILTFAASSMASLYARQFYEEGFEAGVLAARDALAEAEPAFFDDDQGDFLLSARDYYDDDFYPIYARGGAASKMANHVSNTMDSRVIRGGGNTIKKASNYDSQEKAKSKAHWSQPTPQQRIKESKKHSSSGGR